VAESIPDIIPIELGLTAGNGLTLWAPRWHEDGEDWEAFLGSGDDLYVFPDPAHLAAFVRTSTEHDLLDHPEWPTAVRLLTDELSPDDDHRFDIVGVPDLVAEPADIWTLAELADTVAILRSLADVCDLQIVSEVLDSTEGFSVLGLGEQAFTGRVGEKLWDEIGTAVAARWDEVVDALDSIVKVPEVDAGALATAQAEAAAVLAAVAAAGEPQEERDPDLEFWEGAGIDPVEVTVGGRTGFTLRCYLDDVPLFLSRGGEILVFSSAEGLENYIADPKVRHRLSDLNFWPEIRDAVAGGDAAVVAGSENTYVLDGLAEQIAAGPETVDSAQLDLAVELLTDAAEARSDEETVEALSSASPLGNLIGSLTDSDPDRMAPAPPYDDEAAAWTVLVDRFAATLEWDPEA
jgi:hypothetical protein